MEKCYIRIVIPLPKTKVIYQYQNSLKNTFCIAIAVLRYCTKNMLKNIENLLLKYYKKR